MTNIMDMTKEEKYNHLNALKISLDVFSEIVIGVANETARAVAEEDDVDIALETQATFDTIYKAAIGYYNLAMGIVTAQELNDGGDGFSGTDREVEVETDRTDLHTDRGEGGDVASTEGHEPSTAGTDTSEGIEHDSGDRDGSDTDTGK